VSRSLRRRVSRVATAVCAAAVLLTGCGAGQTADTAVQGSSAGGARAGAPGGVAVRDAGIEFGAAQAAAVVYPAGATAPLRMTVVNDGGVPDRLLSVSSPKAVGGQISGVTDLPPGEALVVGSIPVALPQARTAQVWLVGLTEDVRAGLTYPVVLQFEKAGRIALDLPVDNPATEREPATEPETE